MKRKEKSYNYFQIQFLIISVIQSLTLSSNESDINKLNFLNNAKTDE